MSFASAYLDSMSLGELVRPHLQSVRDETGDSSSLAVLTGSDILYLVHVSTNRMVRLAAGVGTRYPALCDLAGPRPAGVRARGRPQPLSRHRQLHAVHRAHRHRPRRAAQAVPRGPPERLCRDAGRARLRLDLHRGADPGRQRALAGGDQLLDLDLAREQGRADPHPPADPCSRRPHDRDRAAAPTLLLRSVHPD
ncbi:MAG: hypothetical protein WDN03_12410 [Rhizomicrobium sp.]